MRVGGAPITHHASADTTQPGRIGVPCYYSTWSWWPLQHWKAGGGGSLITTGWWWKSWHYTRHPLTLPSREREGCYITVCGHGNPAPQVSGHFVTICKGRRLGSPLGLCWHGWCSATVFSVVFGYNSGVIILKFSVLLGCTFPSPLAKENRLLLECFCLYPLAFLSCWPLEQ